MNQLKILLIEDDKIETMKLERAMSTLAYEHEVVTAQNGEIALDYLKETDQLPSIIFLDLNMPKINGIEFLKLLKKDDRLRYLPTVILTTSDNRKDVLECYKTGVAGYILKPLKYDAYVSKIEKVVNYWSENVLITDDAS
ncbi:MAG: response regulator [Gilvibacter sp.]